MLVRGSPANSPWQKALYLAKAESRFNLGIATNFPWEILFWEKRLLRRLRLQVQRDQKAKRLLKMARESVSHNYQLKDLVENLILGQLRLFFYNYLSEEPYRGLALGGLTDPQLIAYWQSFTDWLDNLPNNRQIIIADGILSVLNDCEMELLDYLEMPPLAIEGKALSIHRDAQYFRQVSFDIRPTKREFEREEDLNYWAEFERILFEELSPEEVLITSTALASVFEAVRDEIIAILSSQPPPEF